MDHNGRAEGTLAPVILFVYNRADHTKKTVEALKHCVFAGQSDLYVYSDGNKGEKDLEAVEEVRSFIKRITGFHRVHIIERDRNFGLADNIIEGVTRIIEKYGKAIILEDDVVVSRYFLQFMNDGLERYEKQERIMAVCAHMPPVKDTERLPDTFFSPWFDCQGWGTWNRSWKYYQRDPEKMIQSATKELIEHINFDGATNKMWKQVVDNCKGRIKTWAIFFYAEICRRDGLVLQCREGLCYNIGFDGSGVNSGIDDGSRYDRFTTETGEISGFPEKIEANKNAMELIRDYQHRLLSDQPNIVLRIVKVLRKEGVSGVLKRVGFMVKKKE